MIPSLKPGDRFPDYELPDHRGAPRKISELQGNDPLALVLARGSYCPKEDLQHQWMAAMQTELKVGYCRFVTISTDQQMQSLEWRTRLGAHWPFLCDPDRKLQRELDIQEYTDPEHDPMIPHTLLLAPGLRIYAIYQGYWYFGRPTAEEIRQDFRAISRKCRPDWEINAPALRRQYENGEREDFFPYNSRSDA
ncbi:peroxiredoxin [Neolewinella xylanilytica]|uniref:Peroxiredoxin n=1 Tax=Neolewinella xylanilytica TaxID=1514080 RepID=A0A2S6IAD0_9BACT|nr:redoxin domain-containing protein [Neolewinella xylanilytica]PPK88448.1 peroxiredoxin [Neolewinella xylanilytica]